MTRDIETALILSAIKTLIALWSEQLGPKFQLILGGSLVSDTFVSDGAKTIDVDLRFLVDNPDEPGLIDQVEAVTGLRYKKTNDAVADWPSGKSAAHMIEGFLEVEGIPLPLEIEGCLRNKRYVGWHRYYKEVFSEEELAEFRADKIRLRSDKSAYKKRKSQMRDECQRRAIEMGLVSPDRAPFE
jgi:hypothetical protein